MKIKEDIYRYGSLRLENGLLRQSYDLHLISQGVFGMPTGVFITLQESKHPEILAAKYPCPREFKFEENELVVILPVVKSGKVKALRQCELEIELLNGEGDVNVSWENVRKYVVLGDYVEILSGAYQGCKGWITAALGNTVTVMEIPSKKRENHPYNTLSRMMKVCFPFCRSNCALY